MVVVRGIENEAELALSQRLRAAVYVREKGWVPPEGLVDGREVDADDPASIHVGAYDRAGRMVGVFRIIPGTGSLPVERLFDLSIPTGRRTAELSRLAVLPSRRCSMVSIALFRWVYRYTVDHDVDEVYAVLEEPLLRSLQRMGFPFVPVGAARHVYNCWNYPTRCRRDEVLPSLAAADQNRLVKLEPFFARDDLDQVFTRRDLQPIATIAGRPAA